MAGLARGREVADVAGVGSDEAGDEFRPDLVIVGADRGAEHRDDAFAPGAELSMAAMVFSSTPVKAPFQPACAAPMTRASASANSTGPAIGRSRRRWRCPGRSVTMASAFGRVARKGLAHDDDVGRMDLVGGQELVRRARPSRRRRGGGSRPPSALSSSEPTPMLRPCRCLGNAAGAGEIAVADALRAAASSSSGDRTGAGLCRWSIASLVAPDAVSSSVSNVAREPSLPGGRVGQADGDESTRAGQSRPGHAGGRHRQHLEQLAHGVRAGQAFDIAGDLARPPASASAPSRPARSRRPMPSRKSPCVARWASRPCARTVAARAAKSTCEVRSASPGLASTSS